MVLQTSTALNHLLHRSPSTRSGCQWHPQRQPRRQREVTTSHLPPRVCEGIILPALHDHATAITFTSLHVVGKKYNFFFSFRAAWRHLPGLFWPPRSRLRINSVQGLLRKKLEYQPMLFYVINHPGQCSRSKPERARTIYKTLPP